VLVQRRNPAILVHLGSSGSAVVAESGAEHGQQRHALGFDVVAVAREWAIVRDVILELIIEDAGRLDLDEYKILSRHVSAAAISAIQEHVEMAARERDRLTAQHVGFMVHDLRNQLTGATAALSWMKLSPAHTAEATEAIGASLVELTRLLDRELTLARLTALKSGTQLHAEPILVADLLALAEGEVRALAAMRQVAVTTDCESGLTIRGDLRLLRSALVNLTGNAVKFTRPATAVAIAARTAGAFVEISVADGCGGLADDAREHMFAEHEQVGSDRSGFGLGLAICRQAVEAHGGAVTVQNRPGAGCTFVIALPRDEP
jgi:signal transduction histidine kinase